MREMPDLSLTWHPSLRIAFSLGTRLRNRFSIGYSRHYKTPLLRRHSRNPLFPLRFPWWSVTLTPPSQLA